MMIKYVLKVKFNVNCTCSLRFNLLSKFPSSMPFPSSMQFSSSTTFASSIALQSSATFPQLRSLLRNPESLDEEEDDEELRRKRSWPTPVKNIEN